MSEQRGASKFAGEQVAFTYVLSFRHDKITGKVYVQDGHHFFRRRLRLATFFQTDRT